MRLQHKHCCRGAPHACFDGGHNTPKQRRRHEAHSHAMCTPAQPCRCKACGATPRCCPRRCGQLHVVATVNTGPGYQVIHTRAIQQRLRLRTQRLGRICRSIQTRTGKHGSHDTNTRSAHTLLARTVQGGEEGGALRDKTPLRSWRIGSSRAQQLRSRTAPGTSHL